MIIPKKERVCIMCRYFYFDSGSPGFSEMTPGSDAFMECYKKHWDISLHCEETQKSFREKLLMAKSCDDFDLHDECKHSNRGGK